MCMPAKFAEKYIQSDFVARVKIVKVYKNEGNDQFYKSDLLIRELYKGNNITSIDIEGSSIPDERRGSCGLFFPTNTELIIYATKKSDETYIFDSCSGTVKITGRYTSEQRELDMLNSLKSLHYNHTDKIWFFKKQGFDQELASFNGVQSNKVYGLYEITFSSGLVVKSVRLVSGFSNEIDDKLIRILKDSEWATSIYDSSASTVIKNHVPDNSKHLVGFYFYPPEKGYESFVSEYDL